MYLPCLFWVNMIDNKPTNISNLYIKIFWKFQTKENARHLERYMLKQSCITHDLPVTKSLVTQDKPELLCKKDHSRQAKSFSLQS